MRSSAGRSGFLVLAALLLPALLLLLQSACGKPFNVRPKVELRSTGAYPSGAAEGVTVHAGAVADENALYDAFDANLILAGVLPVRVEFLNRRTESVDLKKVKFELRSDGGSKLKVLKPGSAYKRLISYYGVSAWTVSGYKESRGDFESYALNQRRPLGAGESRDGLLFFRLASEADLSHQLTLRVKGLAGSRESQIDLNLGRLR
jgi:hypothetical protein